MQHAAKSSLRRPALRMPTHIVSSPTVQIYRATQRSLFGAQVQNVWNKGKDGSGDKVESDDKGWKAKKPVEDNIWTVQDTAIKDKQEVWKLWNKDTNKGNSKQKDEEDNNYKKSKDYKEDDEKNKYKQGKDNTVVKEKKGKEDKDKNEDAEVSICQLVAALTVPLHVLSMLCARRQPLNVWCILLLSVAVLQNDCSHFQSAAHRKMVCLQFVWKKAGEYDKQDKGKKVRPSWATACVRAVLHSCSPTGLWHDASADLRSPTFMIVPRLYSSCWPALHT